MIQSNQKSSQQKGFFAAHGHYLQSMQNHGLQNLASTSFAHSHALQASIAMPLPRSRPPSFCPLSPEAALLTTENINRHCER
ncbi:hypothetical protein GWR56_18760 [Mucilaginibacter sp. 14171R-50]|uniref:hypothetical protein n=1 Tax=Mucilaginibacter sp. 14171R-50 TaxID=2703789 RepID=UPI00138CD1EC|nr:hypothetical protein [Mucilaginibacter sp. 14171R-50]QHS57487.1 hypothetical protein GWR56_18760 [Mucilaginibacter sp. 14171R-50]